MKTYLVSLTVDLGSANTTVEVEAESVEEAQEKAESEVYGIFEDAIEGSKLSEYCIEVDQVIVDSCEEIS